jgi:hypothetical protein
MFFGTGLACAPFLTEFFLYHDSIFKVGTSISAEHLAASPIGMTVREQPLLSDSNFADEMRSDHSSGYSFQG